MPTQNFLVVTTGNLSWTAGANWSQTTAPAAGEAVTIGAADNNCIFNAGLAGNTATLESLDISRAFVGQIGTATAYLEQPASTINIGTPVATGNPNGSTRIKLNAGTAAATINVFGSATTGADAYLDPVRLLANNAATVLNVLGGAVGLATATPAETATVGTINQTGGTLNVGIGATWTTFNQSSGTATIKSGGSTVTQTSGTLTLMGTGTVPTISAAGTVILNMRASAGTTSSNVNLFDGATLDLTGNPAAITLSTVTAKAGSKCKILPNPANPSHLTITTLVREPGSELTIG